MESQADEWREAPTLLVDVERQVGEVSRGGVIGFDVAAIVAVIVVGTKTRGSREAVEQLLSKVELTAIDVLLTLHLGIELVGGDDGRSTHSRI